MYFIVYMTKLILLFVSFLLFASSCIYAQTSRTSVIKINQLTGTRENIIKNFCNYAYNYVPANNISFVEAKNSIFLKILCNTTSIETTNKFKMWLVLRKNIIKYYWDLKIDAKNDSEILPRFSLFWKCINNDGINIDPESLNNVNFVCVANDIFDKLSEDEINLASYIAYGWFSDKSDFWKWQSDFFSGAICSDKYLNWNNPYCKHPNTYKYLKSMNASLKNILNNLILFKSISDINQIQTIILSKSDQNKCKNWWCLLLLSLKNSIYNELYFYTMFLSVYSESLKISSLTTSNKRVGASIDNVYIKPWLKEILLAQNSIFIRRLTIKKSFNIIKNIYWTYPIHVWFLAIMEDFKKFRNVLAKIYTPIDQLRYKLENVQDLSKH